MNILFIIPKLEFGGAQTFLVRLANALSSEHNISIYEVYPNSDDSLSNKLHKNINQYKSIANILISKKRSQNLISKLIKRFESSKIFNALVFLHIRYILARRNIDIVNSHMYLADIFSINVLPKTTPIISTMHGCYNLLLQFLDNHPLKTEIFTNQFEDIFKRLDGYIWLTTAHHRVFDVYPFLSRPVNKKIYNGFQRKDLELDRNRIREKLSISLDSFVFVMVSRGDRSKGWDELLKAFHILQSRTSQPTDLVLVGYSDHIHSLNLKYKKFKNIHFIGNSSNPIEYIEASDVGVLPTFFPAESLPNVIVEYLSCGKPVISTNIGEIPLMINNSGQILDTFPNGPVDVVKLCHSMLNYINDPSLYQSHKKAALINYTLFSMDACVHAYISFFNDIIRGEN